MIEIGEGLVREKVTLQVAPGSLDVIQLRSIFRQPFDRQPRARGQGRLGGFTGMDWAIVKNEGDRLLGPGRAWPIESIEAAQHYDEVAAALGRAGVDDQPAAGTIENAEHRPLARAPRRLDLQILAPLGPDVSGIGVSERLRLVAKQQCDIAGFGLLLQQAQAQPGTVNRIGILPSS